MQAEKVSKEPQAADANLAGCMATPLKVFSIGASDCIRLSARCTQKVSASVDEALCELSVRPVESAEV